MSNAEKVADLSSLHKAYKRVIRGKRDRRAAIEFSLSPLSNLCEIRKSLLDQTYQMGDYTRFPVSRPVRRDVCACAFKDKIVLRSLCENVLWDTVNPHLIEDNYASRVGYGTHVAIDKLERNLRRHYLNHGTSGYVLKMDVRKYFYNLCHDSIRHDMAGYGLDDWTLWLCDVVLDSNHHSVKKGYEIDDGKNLHIVFDEAAGNKEIEVGSPIGNETSQVFAVQYLNKIDHFIKDQCGVKAYGRYMDDSYIIHPSKEYLEELLQTLNAKYGDIGLELNQKTQIFPLKNGVNFLGMRLCLTDTGKVIRRLKPSNIKYQRVRIREDAQKVAKGVMTELSYWRRRQSWDSYASHADTSKLRKKMKNYAKEALRNAYRKEQRKLGDVSSDVEAVPGT